MYQLSFAGLSLSIGTLFEVLAVFRTDARLLALESSEIVLQHCGQPVRVIRHNGSLTVRRPGTARDVFLSLLDEIDGAYFRPNGALQAAWQIRRSRWKLLYDAFDLTSTLRLIISSEQIDAAANGQGHIGLHELLQSECERRFGFRYAGPEYGHTRHLNGRHEVHVAYALAEGWPVPEAVLDEYRQLPDRFTTDVTWGKALIRGRTVMKIARYIANVAATLVLGDLLARQVATAVYASPDAVQSIRRLLMSVGVLKPDSSYDIDGPLLIAILAVSVG
ncbi:hypothetical protein [Paraburkholderia dilworthii]|uniref:hypothetical protein n=1 Tax=Paraburkholderia dilworthii TaxID=948106 RepID=UPI00042945A2|nr:hypothetical protein [Paraburkholderia dilworthii]